jgi:hypothetical protein
MPQQADDLDRLLEHLDPLVGRGPARAGDVLVEVLARADAGEEAARHERLGGRRGLRDDRGVDPDQRARDPGAEAEALRRAGDPADHAPYERAVPLLRDPWVEVVGDQAEAEARLLGRRRVGDEVARPVLLRRERVAELHGGSTYRRAGA